MIMFSNFIDDDEEDDFSQGYQNDDEDDWWQQEEDDDDREVIDMCLFNKKFNDKNSAKYKLVNMKSMLTKAVAGHYAVPHININNLEWIKACLQAAQDSHSPIILGVSEGAAKYMCGFENIVKMVESCMAYMKITVPVALHLDHGTFSGAMKALRAGFSSVMFDGSKLEFAKNIENLKSVLKLVKKTNATVEAEVGGIGGSEDGVTSAGELADVNQCKILSQTKITCLAAGIGNIHGIYPKNWKGLNFKRLEDIANATNHIPLVLHGGTGINQKMIQQAIALGVAKINVNTECQLAFAATTRTYITKIQDLDKKAKGFDPRKLLKPGTEAIYKTVIEKMTIFGSIDKA